MNDHDESGQSPEELPEDDYMRELLGNLREDYSDPPAQLTDRTIRKVQAELTSRDLIDLTTFVFLMRFCAPLLDLFAAFFGHDPMTASKSNRSTPTPSRSENRSTPDD